MIHCVVHSCDHTNARYPPSVRLPSPTTAAPVTEVVTEAGASYSTAQDRKAIKPMVSDAKQMLECLSFPAEVFESVQKCTSPS